VLLHGASDQAEHRRPETDEERAPFRIAPLVLIDRPGPDPVVEAGTVPSEPV
jgi:hypothetical protein